MRKLKVGGAFLLTLFCILILSLVPSWHSRDNSIASAENISPVLSYTDLVNEINSAPTDNTLTLIEVDDNISITSPLIIKNGQHIVLKAADGKNISLLHQMSAKDSIINISESATFSLGQSTDDAGVITLNANGIGSGEIVHNLGTFILNQGIITGATGSLDTTCGGGVFNGGIFVMNGGQITNNNAVKDSDANGGGAVYTINEFTMNGGSITHNSAGNPNNPTDVGVGGGVFVRSGEMTLNRGKISHNSAGTGGAIYLYGISNLPGEYATLTLGEGVITKNTATFQGGGVWFCPSGEAYNNHDMTSVFGNTALTVDDYRAGGDDFFFVKKDTSDFSVSLPDSSLIGEDFNYYKDLPRYDGTSSPISVKNLNLSDNFGLHVGTDNINTQLNLNEASWTITDNLAREGGGVASNGIVNFGEERTIGAAQAELSFTKTLVGRTLKEGEFEFQLKNSDGKIVDTVTNKADGSIIFKKLTFVTEGTYEFTASEIKSKLPSIISDSHEEKVKIIVTRSGNQLNTKVNYLGNQTFNNLYEPLPTSVRFDLTKKLVGRDLLADEFQFQLKDDQGKLLQTVKNGADGSISFDEIKYDKPGVYNYTVSEINDKKSGITYDDHEIEISVKVSDTDGKLSSEISYQGDKVFTNNFTKETTDNSSGTKPSSNNKNDAPSSETNNSPLPKTGSNENLLVILFGVVILILGGYFYSSKIRK